MLFKNLVSAVAVLSTLGLGVAAQASQLQNLECHNGITIPVGSNSLSFKKTLFELSQDEKTSLYSATLELRDDQGATTVSLSKSDLVCSSTVSEDGVLNRLRCHRPESNDQEMTVRSLTSNGKVVSIAMAAGAVTYWTSACHSLQDRL